MASTTYDLKLKISADNKASGELDKVSKQTQNLQKQGFQWSKSTETALKRVGATATVVAGSMVALGKSFVDNAIKIEPVKNAYKQLATSVGESADDMMASLRKASVGAVKDYDLMLAANKSMKLGVAKNTEDMTDLMKIARLYGQQFGQDVTKSFDDIVTGLGRGSTQILDNLGIVIKQTEAQELYAQQLGKTVDQLTEEEKKQALTNAVLAEGRRVLEEFGEAPKTVQERIDALGVQFDTMKTTLGEALLPVIEKVMDVVTPIIEKVGKWIEDNPKLATTIFGVVTAVSGLIAVVSGLALALPAIGTAISVLSGPIGWIIGAIALVATAWANNWGGIQEKTQVAVEHIEKIIGPRLDKLKAWRKDHGETVMIYVEAVMGAIADTIGTVLGLIATGIAGTFETIDSATKLFKAIWNGDWEGVCDIAVEWANNMDQLLTDSFGDTRTSIKQGVQGVYDWIVEKLTSIVNAVKNIVSQIKDAWNSAKNAVSDFGTNAVNKVKNFFGGGKAEGGPVNAGTTYLVGEKGPELFVPNKSGTIIPNEEITKNNNVTINMSGITIREDADIEKLANEIVRMTKLEKNYGIY